MYFTGNLEVLLFHCICCENEFIDDDMVSYSYKAMKGFCRKCSKKLDFETMKRMEKDGFDFGEQLSLI